MKLTVSGGSFRYSKGRRQILSDIGFSLSEGEILAVLGPNGAGKTTLLRCTIGLLPWQSGETRIDGTPLSAIPQRTLWQKISYVPQAQRSVAAYTVEDMVMLGRASLIGPFSVPGQKDREAVERCLTKMKLNDLRHRSCGTLSGGEFQMVLFARALASDPELLILDEPESNLDYPNQLLVLDAISELAKEGISCIFNTHYPAHALRRATKALMLAKDGSYTFGDVHTVVTEEELFRCFGVRSVIGEVETGDTTYMDVVPVAVGASDEPSLTADSRVIAGITVLMEEREHADQLNGILHEFGDDLIGRMGLPYRRAGTHIIMLTLDTKLGRVRQLTERLRRLPGAHVKTAYIKGNED